MPRLLLVLRLIVPTLWLGLIVGLSFIETPLKFLAPGITLPLGLGVGRLVFTALAIAGWVLLVALTLVAIPVPRIDRAGWAQLGALWVVLAVQTLLIRPALNARSDIVMAGGDPGPSWLHYGYIAADVAIVLLLVVWIVRVARGIRLAPEAIQRS
ncbi:hypothetical protein ACFC3F_13235 [Microbacterium sp. NPDC055910]|uniref:hypothetical protein n=1 Tax=Microbacterium sp. NPDC055910 TaxID=3345659 RepID=UPI0035D96C36